MQRHVRGRLTIAATAATSIASSQSSIQAAMPAAAYCATCSSSAVTTSSAMVVDSITPTFSSQTAGSLCPWSWILCNAYHKQTFASKYTGCGVEGGHRHND